MPIRIGLRGSEGVDPCQRRSLTFYSFAARSLRPRGGRTAAAAVRHPVHVSLTAVVASQRFLPNVNATSAALPSRRRTARTTTTQTGYDEAGRAETR